METDTPCPDHSLAIPASVLSVLVRTLNPSSEGPDADRGPAAPIIRRLGRRILELRALVEPQSDPLGPQPEPWRFSGVADLAADRLVTLAHVSITPDAQRSFQQRVAAFADDFCSTPPRVRWPWPGPNREISLTPFVQVLVGAQFLNASRDIDDPVCASAVAAAGEQIAQAGLQGLERA